MSEKIDGVRAYWDGNKLLSRTGKKVSAPSWFLDALPVEIQVEGILCHENHDTLLQLIKGIQSDWSTVKFHLFDIPSSNKAFHQRLGDLQQLKVSSHIEIVEFIPCESNKHLEEYLQHGEIIAIDPNSSYVPGKNNSLIKVKKYGDSEVELLEVLPSGLFCKQQNEKTVIVNCSDDVLANPPAMGSVLIVKHSGHYGNGKLKHPIYWDKREDTTPEVSNTPIENAQAFFEELGKKFHISKLDDWYKVSREDIYSNGGRGLLKSSFGDSLVNALTSVYPNHQWSPWAFSNYVPVGFWEDRNNQRKYFAWLGQTLGYKTIDDWYNLTLEILSEHHGSPLMIYHNNSPWKALKNVYPEHDWLPWKFSKVPSKVWQNRDNHKLYFDWLGKQLGIEKMDDWYNITQDLICHNGGNGLMANYYKNSPLRAVMSVYPEHQWLPWKFTHVPNRYWNDESHQKKFFDWLGKELNFKSMEDWYSITFDKIDKHGGAGLLATFFNNSPKLAVMKMFPEYAWQKDKFLSHSVK